jgi:hypothetical protein
VPLVRLDAQPEPEAPAEPLLHPHHPHHNDG